MSLLRHHSLTMQGGAVTEWNVEYNDTVRYDLLVGNLWTKNSSNYFVCPALSSYYIDTTEISNYAEFTCKNSADGIDIPMIGLDKFYDGNDLAVNSADYLFRNIGGWENGVNVFAVGETTWNVLRINNTGVVELYGTNDGIDRILRGTFPTPANGKYYLYAGDYYSGRYCLESKLIKL